MGRKTTIGEQLFFPEGYPDEFMAAVEEEQNKPSRLPVVLGRTDGKPLPKGANKRGVRRFSLISSAVEFLNGIIQPLDPKGVAAGEYYIDAPESMMNGLPKTTEECAMKKVVKSFRELRPGDRVVVLHSSRVLESVAEHDLSKDCMVLHFTDGSYEVRHKTNFPEVVIPNPCGDCGHDHGDHDEYGSCLRCGNCQGWIES